MTVYVLEKCWITLLEVLTSRFGRSCDLPESSIPQGGPASGRLLSSGARAPVSDGRSGGFESSRSIANKGTAWAVPQPGLFYFSFLFYGCNQMATNG